MYTTTYRKRVKKRKGPNKGRTVIEDRVYQTKSLTPPHKGLREAYPSAETYEGGELVWLIEGVCPVVLGGRKIA